MKRAVITGATGGIGGKTAEVLGLAGYEVIVTGIDEAGRQAVMSNLESKGVKAHFYFCDATNEEQVNETFAKIAQKFDSIDLLVNNVGGLGGRQRVSEMETSFMRKGMALNFDSLFFNTRAALLHVMGDLLGSVAAILAGALIYFFGEKFAIADPILSFVVGALVLHSTYEVLKDSSAVLLDGVPEGVNYYDVGDALSRIPGVSRVHDLHVWTLAPGHGAVMAHLCVKEGIDWEKVLSDAQKMLLTEFGLEHITLQPEWHCAGGCSTTCRQCQKQREEALRPQGEESASEDGKAFHSKEGLNVLG